MAEEWRLRDEQGSVRSLTTQELRDGLARGVIPSSALVQRAGGKDYAPAFSVPELATAAIRAKRTPSIPPGGGGPPSAPKPPPRPGSENIPAAPRSRRRIAHTLVGIQGDEEEGLAPASLGAPIVAPGSGASPGAPRAITQVPRYTPSPPVSSPPSEDVVIPRAPRAPGSTTLTVTDQGWEASSDLSGGRAEGGSIFDGEEDAQTLVQKSAPPAGDGPKRPPPKAPGKPPGPPPKAADPTRRPSQQPPPLPPKREGALGAPPGRPPMRNTVMGLGTGGARVVPPRAPAVGAKPGSSTPPPARPVSKPPPAPPLKRTPQPPAVAPTVTTKAILDEPTLPLAGSSTGAGSPIADEVTDVTPPPDAVKAAAAKADASPKPPAATSPKPPAVDRGAASPKPPATTSAKPAAPTPSAKPPATPSAKPPTAPSASTVASTHETLTGGAAAPAAELAASAIASGATATASPPAVEGTPTVPMPEAREGAAPLEGTPTVPMPEARDKADVDDAPTSKMAVQIVHGAAMAMRAALAAPKHEAPGTSASSPPEAVPPSAMPPVSAAPASAPAPQGSGSASPSASVGSAADRPSPILPSSGASAGADVESALASGSTSVKLPRPGRMPRESDASSGTPLMGSTPPPAANDAGDEDAAPQSGVEVPVSSLFAASGVWIAGLILVFFVGRCSAIEVRSGPARSVIGPAARLIMRAASAGGAGAGGELRACNVSRRPTRWAPAASKNVPFEMAPIAGATAMLVGYGGSDEVGVGLRVDPKTGKFEKVFDQKVDAGVVRVTPLPGKSPTDAPEFFATPKADATLVPVAGVDPPVWIRFGEGGIETLPAPDGAPAMAFPFQGGDRSNAEQVVGTSAGVYLSFRRGEGIMGGWVDGTGKSKGELASVVGSGGKVGKPRASWNGKEIAVTFADKPEGSPWQVRVGHAAGGAVPTTTKAFDLPAGGPGGDAIAPDIVGLPDGRWLLMWTEGAAGNRAIQSITLAPDFTPIGDAIALSPPSGNFGQAQLGVVGRYVTVLFLQKGDEDFELWGAVLQCG